MIILVHLVVVQSEEIFKILTKKNECTIWLIFLKIPELWTATTCTRIIALTEVRSVLKTSFHWLLNGVKQKIPNVLFDCVLKA